MTSLAALVVALLIGLLIGLDRERAEARKGRALFAGVRTFPLIALAGALAMELREAAGVGLVLAAFVAVGAVAVVAYARSAAAGDVGATTEIAALVTFLLGVLAGTGQLELAAACGVGVAVLLAAKPPLERLSRTLTTDELIAVLELAVVSVIVLPLLPDRGYGPWGALNPRQIWVVVVLVSALSFAGFVAARVFGPRRGTIVTGGIGGLVSSTAVTLALAQRARAGDAGRATIAAAVLASTVMCGRLAVLAAVARPAVLLPLLPVVGAMAVAGTVATVLLARDATRERAPEPGLVNPFRPAAALAFAAIYAAVVLLARAAQETLGARGLYATAVVSALVDADAPTIAIARLPDVAPPVAAAAIGVAAVTNTVAKLVLAAAIGRGTFGRLTALALGAMAAVGIVAVAARATWS
jgi:uncharacterized membrane protein (DUF4010 family)